MVDMEILQRHLDIAYIYLWTTFWPLIPIVLYGDTSGSESLKPAV